MAETDIMKNQATILDNQKTILSDQESIVENQKAILHNQETLDKIEGDVLDIRPGITDEFYHLFFGGSEKAIEALHQAAGAE